MKNKLLLQKDLPKRFGQVVFRQQRKRAWVAAGFSLRSWVLSLRAKRGNLGFFFIAMSATEVQSHMYVALDQAYVSQDAFDEIYEQAGKTSRMISGLIKYLRRGLTKQTKQTE